MQNTSQIISLSLSLSFSVSVSLSLSLSPWFNGHFLGGPGLACARMSPFWILLELRMMQVHGGYNASYMYKLFTGRMPFLSPNQQCQSKLLLLVLV